MKDENPNPLPVSTCPVCGYQMDAATCPGNDEARPGPGDVGLCFKCGEVMTFQEDKTLRLATLTDLGTLSEVESKLLTQAQALIREKRPLG
jgi:hypothetical protein